MGGLNVQKFKTVYTIKNTWEVNEFTEFPNKQTKKFDLTTFLKIQPSLDYLEEALSHNANIDDERRF